MSRRKAKGTTPTFRDQFPGGEVVVDLATQNMNLRKQVERAVAEVNVTRTILAAVLSTSPDRIASVTAEQIAELQGRAFTIEKRNTEDGGLEVRAELLPIVEAEPVEEVPNEDSERNG